VDRWAVETYQAAIEKVKAEGGKILVGGEVLSGEGYESGCFVTPSIAEVENHYEIVQNETFAPLLYMIIPIWKKPFRFTTMFRRACHRQYFPGTCWKLNDSCHTKDPIAELLT